MTDANNPAEAKAVPEANTASYTKVEEAIQAGAAKNWPLAETLYGDAYKLDNSNARAANGMAMVAKAQGRADEALKWFQQALDLYARKAGNADAESALIAHNGMGQIYYNMGEYKAALASFDKSAQLDPQNPVTLEAYAKTYASMGDDEKAKEYFQQVMAFQPDNAYALSQLGKLAEKDKPAIALEYAKKAAELEPANQNYAAAFARIKAQGKGAGLER